MRITTRIGALAAAASIALAGAGIAYAHDGASSDDGAIDNAKATHNHHDNQHGDIDGHLPASSSNVEVVSKLALKNAVPEKIADVGVHKGYAYLAAWGVVTCKYNGVHVVDIKNPAAPKEVAFIGSKEGSYPGEGVQALSINTPQFKGDILVTNNETCNEKTGFGGLNIYDITRPSSPTPLTEGYGDATVAGQGKKAANEIHSVFAWNADNKAYAVIVDNDEGADVDIVDISNPRKPKLIKEYDLDEDFPEITQASPTSLVDVFHHDMVVKKIGTRWVLLASYWDGGYVKLDVTDPANATLIADSDFAEVDPELLYQTGLSEAPEGNAHQAEFTIDNQYIIAADEDFSPTGFAATSDDDGAFVAVQADATKPVDVGDTVSGPTAYVGRGCTGDLAIPAPVGSQIAVIARGLCTFNEKFVNVEAANAAAALVDPANAYIAAIVVEREGADACGLVRMAASADIPGVFVSRQTGYNLFDIADFDQADCLGGLDQELPGVALGQVGDTVTLRSFFDGWGYVHLFENNASGKLVELDTYAIPESMNPDNATGKGDLSVHEVAVSLTDASLQYYSNYSGGLRVTRIVDGELVEVGHFIDEDGNNLWGVEVFTVGDQEYVAASDRDHGLYIFKYVGP